MLNKIYAKVISTTNGYMSDIERLKQYNILHGETYEVERIEINGFNTDVYILDTGHVPFNSVNFEFYTGYGQVFDLFNSEHPLINKNVSY